MNRNSIPEGFETDSLIFKANTPEDNDVWDTMWGALTPDQAGIRLMVVGFTTLGACKDVDYMVGTYAASVDKGGESHFAVKLDKPVKLNELTARFPHFVVYELMTNVDAAVAHMIHPVRCVYVDSLR